MTGATPAAAVDRPDTISSFQDEVAWIASRVFQLIATFRREPHWKLATHEANDIARSFTRMVQKTFPEATAKAIETFFGKWGPIIGFILVMQMIVEPRVHTSQLNRGVARPPLRAMAGGRPTAPQSPTPSQDAPPAIDPTPDAIPVPESRPGSFKDAMDASPVLPAEVPM